MVIITVARKAFAGTVAENATVRGSGALNIRACMIPTFFDSSVSEVDPSSWTYRPPPQVGALGWGFKQRIPNYAPVNGRWPANIILEHRPECRLSGTVRVKGNGHWAAQSGPRSQMTVYLDGWDVQVPDRGNLAAGKDGLEGIPDWDCVDDCPVIQLNDGKKQRSGGKPGAHYEWQGKPQITNAFGRKTGDLGGMTYADQGTVARFFKQVQG